MSLNEILPLHVKEVEDIIYSYMPAKEGYQETVISAMDYSLSAGGKRLRPMLMLEVYRLFGGKKKIVEPFMAALEMIHNYSLVHDDLPCMDNDRLRRGKDTTWVKYGDGMAVLAGDALLNFAYETAVKAFDLAETAEETLLVVKALKSLSKRSGIYGMVGGQTADVEAEEKEIAIDKDRLSFIHELKTGALLQCSFECGAILAGAKDDDIEKMSKAALLIGVAFQIVDDILDVIGDEQTVGKPIGSDERNGKETYITLYGLEKSKEDVKAFSNEALDIINSMEGNNPFLVKLVDSLIDRNF